MCPTSVCWTSVRSGYMGFYGYFLCLVGCFSMIIWTPTVLSVLYASILYFCICTCSAQLSMFHMERRSRNTLIIIIIIICVLHLKSNRSVFWICQISLFYIKVSARLGIHWICNLVVLHLEYNRATSHRYSVRPVYIKCIRLFYTRCFGLFYIKRTGILLT